MNDDADQRRVHLAEQIGFDEFGECENASTDTWVCTRVQLNAFAKACEANGRVQIGAALRHVAGAPTTPLHHSEALTIAADVADAFNKQADAEGSRQ